MIAVDQVALALGRPERPAPLEEPLGRLAAERILITGAHGSIGSAICALDWLSGSAAGVDIDGCDVRDVIEVADTVEAARPTLILHLAAAKSAPGGEADPWATAETNISGTRNILCAAARVDARVVTASTCKACAPETAYGASKLIAERMTLNAGGSVARFFNVVESSGNVFGLWSELPEEAPIPVTTCERYFMSLAEAVSLVLWAAILPPGRYAHHPGSRRRMAEVAADLYPGRPLQAIPLRRGDRLVEPLLGPDERWTRVAEGIIRIRGPHDPEAA